ncbi:uncharacterized protein LOC109799262 [Cajanus cajan]|uniref:Root cap n=1 Tax=Cajanus cajan TaxID=3821 RepID=A0A151TPH6_CAJCA|nr:uncharacterized protein LOC109799262 [Cajanus cajan]KYP68943.1 hypothetical protein KK1_022593 [Cajanus cajan]
MGISSRNGLMYVLLLFAFCEMQIIAGKNTLSCPFRSSPCFGKKVPCPSECPLKSPSDPKAKVCYLDCDNPTCETRCKTRKANCNGRGSACLDPRFVGADGTVFYFHGRRNEHFALVSDTHFQINARFIGLRPATRARDYTWIQALGIILQGPHTFTVEATSSPTWDNDVDHLKFSHDGKPLAIAQGYLSTWQSDHVRVERASSVNSVTITLHGVAEISVNVVPVTREDSRVHNYQIPHDDCFAHLEVQFKFHGLSQKVEGVLGRTYQPDFENPAAKLGVAMPVVGGEDRYRTTSLVAAHCRVCLFGAEETLRAIILQGI